MTTPGPFPGTVYVSSADAGPGAPFTEILCPDDGAPIKAQDVRTVAAVLLANDEAFPNNTVNFTKGINVSNSVPNGDAIGAIGNGTGRGITATGGTSNGTGGRFKGGTTNGIGLEAEGTGTGFGAQIQGGTNGGGLNVSAGGGNNHGIDAYSTGTGHAIRCQQGNIQLNGTEPAASADPGQHVLSAAHYSKAWATVQLDGGGGYAIGDNINVASLTVTATYVEVTWARAFANANYAPIITGEDTGTLFVVGAFQKGSQTTAKTRIRFRDAITNAYLDPSNEIFFFTIDVKGRD